MTCEAKTHRGFGRRVEVEPVLRLLRAELSQGEDALRHGTFPGVVRLQPQHQRTAAQLLEMKRKHKGLHEGNILKSRGNREQRLDCFYHNSFRDDNSAKLISQSKSLFHITLRKEMIS